MVNINVWEILDINSYYCWNTEMRKISALVGLRKVSLKRWNLYWKDSGSRKEREIACAVGHTRGSLNNPGKPKVFTEG